MSKNFHVPRPGSSPIVDHTAFTDARPTLGGPSSSFNPGNAAQAAPLGKGMAPKSIQVGPKRSIAKGLTNKRFQYD